jgi:magnesium-transporting ATPase (P-type)
MRSELQQGNDALLRLMTWFMVPVGVALVVTQLLRSPQPLADALRGSVAGVGAMVPEGLVLLTSAALTLGAVRLARPQAGGAGAAARGVAPDAASTVRYLLSRASR